MGGTRSGKAGVMLLIKAVPGASRTEVAGWLGDRLKIRVAAPPEDGRANLAIREWLAKQLGVRARDVQIVSGHASPMKSVRIANLAPGAIRSAFGPH
jgi:uncharacterized protein